MDECPHCGEALEKKARFCRHCGSDDETGWSPDVEYHSVELPEASSDLEGASDGEPTLQRRRTICIIALAVGAFALIPSRFGEASQMMGLALFVGGAYGLWSTIRGDSTDDSAT